jgi:hypothetical protein
VRATAALFAVACLAGAHGPREAPRGWWAHVAYLAADRLEGRDTGSRGHRLAAEYVAQQFRRVGLQPKGVRGYYQPVKLVTRRLVEEKSRLTLLRGGGATPVRFGEDATVGLRGAPPALLRAPLEFTGYGLVIPETGHDDLAGRDLRGKILVYLSGLPKNVSGNLGAHYSSQRERWAAFAAAGAVGAISISNPKTTEIPWERAAQARLAPAMNLAAGAPEASLLSLTFHPAFAGRLFAGLGHTLEELFAMAERRETLPRFPLAAQLEAEIAVETGSLESDNVVGVLRGADQRLRSEYVILTAHLDHIGRSEPVGGDAINNGAMDNAAGVATLIEIARALRGRKLRRSVLFAAVTGEEKGLLGSRYFAAHPTVPPASLVANLNFDMFLPLFPLRSIMTLGLDESGLGDAMRQAAAEFGLAVQADHEPLRNRFIRSDQYSFIRLGVPALAFKLGFAKGSPEAEIERRWTRERYHAPSDDAGQPVDLEAAGRFNAVMARLVEITANQDERPRWSAESFFRRFARQP